MSVNNVKREKCEHLWAFIDRTRWKTSFIFWDTAPERNRIMIHSFAVHKGNTLWAVVSLAPNIWGSKLCLLLSIFLFWYAFVFVIPDDLPEGILQEPESSFLISSFSGISWMAALIFSLISFTALCHFRLQWRRSRSQSVGKNRMNECGLRFVKCCGNNWLEFSLTKTLRLKMTVTNRNDKTFYLPRSLLVCMSIGRFWIFCGSE